MTLGEPTSLSAFFSASERIGARQPGFGHWPSRKATSQPAQVVKLGGIREIRTENQRKCRAWARHPPLPYHPVQARTAYPRNPRCTNRKNPKAMLATRG